MSIRLPLLPLFSAIVSRLSIYAVLLIAARLLTPDEFGIFAALVIVGSIVNAMVSGGGDMWLNRFVRKHAAGHGQAPEIWPVYLIICSTLAVLSVAAAGFAAVTIDALGAYGAVVFAAVLAYSVAGLAESLLAVVRSTGRVTLFFALRDIFAPLSFLALAAVLRPNRAQDLFVLYATIWGVALFGVLALLIVQRRDVLPRARIRKRQWRIAVRHSLGLMMSNLSSRLSANTDVLVLTVFVSLGQLGEYRVAAQFAIGFMVIQHFFFLGLPWQMRQAGTDEQRRLANAWVGARQRALVISSFLALFFFVAGADTLLWIFGERFVEATLILQLLLLARFAELLWGPQHEILISNGRIRADAEANIASIAAWLPAFGISYLVLAPELAAIVGVVVGSLVGQGHRFRCLRRDGLTCPRFLGSVFHPGGSRVAPKVSRRPELLFVVPSLQLGGTERHLCFVLPRLAGRGWVPTVYTINAKGPLAADLEAMGVRVVGPPFADALAQAGPVERTALRVISAIRLTALIWRMRPGIVHFFLPEAYLLGGLCALTTRRHLLVMSRRSLNNYQASHRRLAWVERWLHPRMTAILGNSQAVTEQLIRDEGVQANKVQLIYNGIDMSLFERRPAGEIRATLDIDKGALVLIIVANLLPYKGHADLLEALRRVCRYLPKNWLLLCAGRWSPADAGLVACASQGGLAGHVRFLGERRDVPDLMAAADIGLLCSHEEGFSNSLLEGMAAGLPMIVTDVGGNVEAVGSAAVIVPPQAPDKLGQVIVELAANSARRRALGDAARQRVRQRFTLERCVEDYDAFYTGIIEGLAPEKANTVPERPARVSTSID